MQQGCHFCTQNLKSVQDIIRHYNDVHGFNKDKSPTFESYIDVISKDPTKFFVEHYKYCTEPPLFDLNFKAEHCLCKHLKLLSVGRENLLIRKISNKDIEFSIDYTHHGKPYDFKDPEQILSNFIENVARVIPDASGEFRLVSCIVNQSAVELYRRIMYTNSCIMTGIIEDLMNNRVKEFLFLNTKKRVLINGENGSNIYFYRFDFLKIHFLTSNLRNYIGVLNRR